MGLNKLYLKNIDELLNEIPEMGYDNFRKRYIKYDVLVGDVKAIHLIHSIVYEDKSHLFNQIKGYEKEMVKQLRKNIKRFKSTDVAVAISFKEVLP